MNLRLGASPVLCLGIPLSFLHISGSWSDFEVMSPSQKQQELNVYAQNFSKRLHFLFNRLFWKNGFCHDLKPSVYL